MLSAMSTAGLIDDEEFAIIKLLILLFPILNELLDEMSSVVWLKCSHLPLGSVMRALTGPWWLDTSCKNVCIWTENVILPPSVLSPWRYVFISQKAYQESETHPESSVYTLMTGTAIHGNDVLDTVEYVRPSEVRPGEMLQHSQDTPTKYSPLA